MVRVMGRKVWSPGEELEELDGRRNLKVGEGRHEEFLLARLLRKKANGRPLVHLPHRDLEHSSTIFGDAAVLKAIPFSIVVDIRPYSTAEQNRKR